MDEMNRISDYRTVEVVAFDADDTLWVNEPFFRESERRFCALVAPWAGAGEAVERLYAREVANMPLYGYGVKACVLSMVETALELGGERLPAAVVGELLALGRDQLQRPPGADFKSSYFSISLIFRTYTTEHQMLIFY